MRWPKWLVFGVWVGLTGWAFAQPVTVQVDCREGMGLIPGVWRGLRGESGHIPEGVEVRTVCLWSEAVRAAWEPKLAGGGYAWSALDEVLEKLKGRDVVLPLPVVAVKAEQWVDLVAETVRHTSGRVNRFEFVDELGSDLDRYLARYESGVWAVYGVDPEVRIGGPGRDWNRGWVEALIGRCKARSLPLHFVSWSATVEQAQDLRRSIEAVEGWVNRAGLNERPELLVSQWQVAGHNSDGLALNLSALVDVLNTDIEAVCVKGWANAGGVTALQALENLAGVRLPMHIDGQSVSGIASVEEPDLLAFFWSNRPGEPVPVSVLFTGLPRGFQVRIEHLQIRSGVWVDEPIQAETRPLREPVKITFPLEAGVLRGIRLKVE